jgi:L-methionine (R)-S-oxide reductase
MIFMEISSDIFDSINKNNKTEVYRFLTEQILLLLADERDWLANSANFASLVFHALPEINWAGFYWLKRGELVLGAFQGKPACVRIAVGKGVCGAAAAKRETVIVANVHEFPGHIACDTASNSEIVVPLVQNGELFGVLDIDSPIFSRFDDEDRRHLESIVQIFLDSTDFSGLA